MDWKIASRLLGQYALARRSGCPNQREAFFDAAYAAFDPSDPSGDVSEEGIVGELRSWRRSAPCELLGVEGRLAAGLATYRLAGAIATKAAEDSVQDACVRAARKAIWERASANGAFPRQRTGT